MGLALILGLASVLAVTSPAVGRRVMGLILLPANAGALLACLSRSKRRPEEGRAWRLLAAALVAAVLFNFFFATRTTHLTQWEFRDGIVMGLQALAGLFQTLGILAFTQGGERLPAVRAHLLGALMFGSSLALLLWILGAWQATGSFARPDQGLLLAIDIRIAITGGLMVYLLAADPRRANGPMGWILLSLLIGGGSGALALRPVTSNPLGGVPVYAALTLMNPIGMILAALHPDSAEPAPDARAFPAALLDALLYLPYLASAGCILYAITRAAQPLVVPVAGFLVVTTLLIAHQFTLLREVRAAKEELDARVRDRTRALEEAQALMLRTERMNSLGLLGAGLAHDLNNALTAITASVAFARDSLRQDGSVDAEDLDRIEQAARHSAALSQRLMSFARRESEAEETLDLGRMVHEDRELLHMLLPARIHLEVQAETGIYRLVASRGQLQQALVNLVANARDAISGTGSIRIGLGLVELGGGRPAAALEISDSGSGMPLEVLEKLFQPLFTTKAPGKGTGLGLASVKVIVERLGGEVQVRSAPGAGTTFTLCLPIQGTGPIPIEAS